MDPTELGRVQSQYASIELADGANINAMATIGGIRGSADGIQTQIGNLEDDSFSGDSSLNSEVSVLNKINASGVLTLRTAAGFKQTPRVASRSSRPFSPNSSAIRPPTPSTSTSDGTPASANNIAQVTGSLTSSIQNFRMP
jgi:hypothetical protein